MAKMIVEREKKMLRQSVRTRERVQLEEAARIAAMYTGKGSGPGAASGAGESRLPVESCIHLPSTHPPIRPSAHPSINPSGHPSPL